MPSLWHFFVFSVCLCRPVAFFHSSPVPDRLSAFFVAASHRIVLLAAPQSHTSTTAAPLSAPARVVCLPCSAHLVPDTTLFFLHLSTTSAFTQTHCARPCPAAANHVTHHCPPAKTLVVSPAQQPNPAIDPQQQQQQQQQPRLLEYNNKHN